MKPHLLLALHLALAVSAPAHAGEHAAAIDGLELAGKGSVTQVPNQMPAGHPRNWKVNVMLTPQSANTWYLGASPGGAGITESGSKLGSVLGAGYTGRVGSSLHYELRMTPADLRRPASGARIQFAVKF